MRLDFHIKNRLKLSATYLVIIMFLCVMFSIVIFNVSSNQISKGLRPPSPEERNERNEQEEIRLIPNGFVEFERFRDDRISESNDYLRRRLIFMNFYALVLGAGISYLLAKKALDPIERAMEKQDRFASDASHELRTPLAAMQSEIEVTLRDKKMNLSEARETLESNLDEVKKMTAISSALLSLAHSEKQSQEFERCDLKKLLEEVVADFKPNENKNEIEIHCDAETEFISGNPEQLKRLFSIILDNAEKYTEQKGSINISVKAMNKSIQIEISDEGIGIDEKDQNLVFDRFYRSDGSRRRDEKSGYGLGLSIAKNIVDLHKGSISAHANLPKGTTIRILLPKN